ncbi:hypothetical protein BU26DRAFT_66689 [Trematosphaeria pertusa]|uniref:P-loop containing nucleoside triphosphate hydrolase protein n=1 Tax=Trematosphaeria pertusa TaxID=390896 RepID=A0A6A6I5F7_9PLEO|nr:uncharacterized protein BU26DRAFT_66689 [Trematosphaeria pertusa]KAF2245278.1 hypothetical protein BU26DRAFT_66689 [Trematosphaeria pertusa]
MANARLIDADDRKRKIPMRVLVLGMCRTGTSSIAEALTKLGYNPHHMTSVMADRSQIPLWHEAANVTFLPDSERPTHLRGLPPYGRAEFDKLLGDYDAVTDLPSALFWKQLIEAYPDAKVVLTNRKYEDWERSMNTSIWMMLQWKLTTFIRTFNLTPMAPMVRMVHTFFKVHNGNHYKPPESKAAYERHYDNIRNFVPKERLLEFGPQFTWEPLCEFLEHKVPEEPYPRLNDSKMMRVRLDDGYKMMSMFVLLKVVLPGAAVAGLAAASYLCRDSIWDYVMKFRRG